tara:strand:+ start:4338 stop:5210 length:873 start_codon:yes stop_codon:yes gene_type:complete
MQKVSDILPFYLNELLGYYHENEIKSFAYLSIDFYLNMTRSDTILYCDNLLSDRDLSKLYSVIDSLKKNKPIQYIFNSTEFYGNKIYCDTNVLIPRQETEELVKWIITDNLGSKKRYLDIGTGSGCIIISLYLKLEGFFKGVDVCNDSINVAIKNAKDNSADISFQQFDVLYNKTTNTQNYNNLIDDKYDVIVSNPPYVLNNEKFRLNKNVIDWEPEIALFVPDNDPLIFYKKIIEISTFILNKNGIIYFEINEKYGKEIILLLKDSGFVNIELKKDINDKDRMIKAILK